MLKVNCQEKSFKVLAQVHLNGDDMEFIVGNADYYTMNLYEFAARFRMEDGSTIDANAISRLDGSFTAEYMDRKKMEAVYYNTANRWNLLYEGKAKENISPLEFYERFDMERPEAPGFRPEEISLRKKVTARFYYRDKSSVYFMDITNDPSTWMITAKDYHEHLGLGFNTFKEVMDALKARMQEIGLEEIAIKVHYEFLDFNL